jgi:hypothetical protein
MATGRKTTPRRGSTLGDSDSDRWLRGKECGPFFEFIGEAYLRKLWLDNRDDIIDEHVAEFPGTRPQRFWEYDAKEPRLRLGGIGTPDFEALNIKPRYKCGIPHSFIDESDVSYFNRTGAFKDAAPNPNKSGPFQGVAVDPDEPPTYESEASYLDRLGLFLPGEKRRLKATDFEPHVVSYIDED